MLEWNSLKVFAKDQELLKGISLSIHSNEILGIFGSSGSGKTTLLKVLLGIPGVLEDFTILGKCFTRPGLKRVCLFQDPVSSFNPHWKIRNSLQEPGESQPEGWLEENLKKYWDRIQIQRPWQDCLQSYPHEFSGGELQRLGFLRAIMASPDLLLLDEPVSALDPMNKKEITKIFVDWQYESGGSVVIVSHDPELTEPFCSRVLHLEQGRLKESQ